MIHYDITIYVEIYRPAGMSCSLPLATNLLLFTNYESAPVQSSSDAQGAFRFTIY